MIYLASDHRGYEMKEKIKQWLESQNMAFEDMGADHFDAEDDYPDFISKAAKKVSQNPEEHRGIILGASGQGEAMVANKFPGVRAMVFNGGYPEFIKQGRVHNNANVLSIGFSVGNTMSERKEMDAEEVIGYIKTFLETEFLNEERHVRRINKIKDIEDSLYK
jgi:ribose 5-phosphate isomerase B